MPMKCDRAAEFRGDILGAALNKAPNTASTFVDLKCRVRDYWNPVSKAWEDWTGYEMDAFGSLCIIKRDGTLHEMQVNALLDHAGWDGEFGSFGNENFQFKPVRFQTKERTFTKDGQTVTVYEVEFINAYDSTPGGALRSNVQENDVKALSAQFGGAIRALKGNAQRNAPKPQGRPATPPPAAPAPAAFNAPDAVETAKRDQASIPF